VAATAAYGRQRGGPRVPIAPFRDHLNGMLSAGWTKRDLAERLGVHERLVTMWLTGRDRIELYTADHLLCLLDRPDLLNVFWPLEDDGD
jgi:hypothetical protein